MEDAKKQGNQARYETMWKWFMSCHVLFLRAQGNKRGRGRKATDTPMARFTAWENGNYRKIIAGFQAADAKATRVESFNNSLNDTRRRALELVGSGQLSRARRLLESLGTADLKDVRIREQLDAKHPRREGDLPEIGNDIRLPRVKVKLEEQYRRLNKFAGKGPDRYSAQYLKTITHRFADNKAGKAVQAHEYIAELYLNAEAPEWVYMAWAMTRMVALVKTLPKSQDEAPDVRPIAVGGIRDRAWLAIAVRDVTPKVREELWPVQVAVGVPSGLEKMAHALRLHLELHPTHVIIKFDFRNAFNSCDRREVLRCILASPGARKLAKVFRATHQPKADIIGISAKSEEGVRQGNPLSSMAFCLLIQEDIVWAQEQLQRVGGRLVFDMDDSYACGPIEPVMQIAKQLAQRLEKRCKVQLQPTKSKIFCQNIETVREYIDSHPECEYRIGKVECADGQEGFGIMTAGLPLGDEQFVNEKLRAKADKVCESINTLTNALRPVSAQSLYAMLMFCCLPQLTYEMRTLHPNMIGPHLEKVDTKLKWAAGIATGVDLDKVKFAMERLRLPKRMYGGGIRKLAEIAPAAFVAGFCDTLPCLVNSPERVGLMHDDAVEVLGPGFHARRRDRFAFLLQTTRSKVGEILYNLWTALQRKVAPEGMDAPVDGPLAVEAAQMGLDMDGGLLTKVQAAITQELDKARFERLDRRLKSIRRTSQLWTFKRQWLSMNRYSTQFVGSIPMDWAPERTLNNEHFTTAWEMYLNAPHSIVADMVAKGTKIKGKKGQAKQLDEFGHLLTSTAGKGLTNARHDSMKWLLDEFLRAADVPHDTEALNVFAGQTGEGGGGQGLIPDFILYEMRGPQGRCLADVKCISVCATRYAAARFSQNKRAEAVATRARMVHGDYIRKAKHADKTYNNTLPNQVGPIEAKLQTFPQTQGLVFGAYGEVSEEVERLLRLCSEKRAARSWRGIGARTKQEATDLLMEDMRARVGILGVRVHAQMKGQRRLEIIGNSKAGAQVAKKKKVAARFNDCAMRREYHRFARPRLGAPGRGNQRDDWGWPTD